MNQIYLKKVTTTPIDQVIAEGFRLFNMEKRLTQAKKVFIKPNLVTDVPEYIAQGANTDIRIIEAVLKQLEQHPHLQVYLGESETGTKTKGRRLQLALERMKVLELQSNYKFKVVNLTHDAHRVVEIAGAKFLKQVSMAKTLMESDLIINLPKLKTHKYSTITCALKNMFGTIPDPMRVRYHENIHQVIADLNRLFYDKTFVITDGVIAMEGDGPLYGKQRRLDLVMVTDNPLVNDVVASQIMKFPESGIKHIHMVNQWAQLDFRSIRLVGDMKLINQIKPFAPAHKNLFIRLEGKLMQYPWVVKLLLNDWLRSHVTYYLNPLMKKLRGGSYSWYK